MFILVVKLATVGTIISLAVSRQWSIHQLDVKHVFLHGHLNKTVYIHQPSGFHDKAHPNHVCYLWKSLYGFIQTYCAWFQCFASFITSINFIHNKNDFSLFIHQ